MRRIIELALPPLLVLGGLALAPGAGAATISPTSWDFGSVGPGASSAAQSFTTTGQLGDNFTGHTALLGSEPDEFKVTADGCTGVHIGNGTTCVVSVTFVPTYEIEGDLSATLFTQQYMGNASQYRAELLGHTVEQGEGGGGKRGGGGSVQAKKKCKKIKDKAKRKKCLKKHQGGAGGTRRH
jgi:hypothetical protein